MFCHTLTKNHRITKTFGHILLTELIPMGKMGFEPIHPAKLEFYLFELIAQIYACRLAGSKRIVCRFLQPSLPMLSTFHRFLQHLRVVVVTCPRLHGFPVSLARPAPHSGKGFEPSCCSTDIRLGSLDNMFNVCCQDSWLPQWALNP